MGRVPAQAVKVPKSFDLFGNTIRVRKATPESLEVNCTYGQWLPGELEIYIRNDLKPDNALQTFWHEFFHAALEAAGKSRESADEQFVETLAGLTLQMLKTAKY